MNYQGKCSNLLALAMKTDRWNKETLEQEIHDECWDTLVENNSNRMYICLEAEKEVSTASFWNLSKEVQEHVVQLALFHLS